MSRTTAKFILTGPRKGQSFNPKNVPGVEFVDGVFETEVEADKLTTLAKVLKSYGAYQKTEVPEEVLEAEKALQGKGKGKKSNAKTTAPKSKSSAKAGKSTEKAPAKGNGPAGAPAGNEGPAAIGTDGDGANGASGEGSEADLI